MILIDFLKLKKELGYNKLYRFYTVVITLAQDQWIWFAFVRQQLPSSPLSRPKSTIVRSQIRLSYRIG